MDKKLVEFFEKKEFEVVEKKTTTQVLIQNLLAFSVREKKGGLFDISINIVKEDEEKEKLRKRINRDMEYSSWMEYLIKLSCAIYSIDPSEIGWDISRSSENEGWNIDFEKTPILHNVTISQFEAFCKQTKLIAQVKRLSEFREVQSEFELAVAEKDGKTLKWRSNLPTEKHIVDAVFKGSEYTHRSVGLGGLTLTKKDVVLDLGGNIGAFTCDIFDKVKKVIVFEPEDVNYEFLSTNIEDNGAKNVVAHKQAVVGNDDKVRDFYLGKAPYYYSFLVKHNRKRVPVECVNINEVMEKYKPTKMKVDIEGSEWEVLINCKDFGDVDQIIFEYNFDMNMDLKEDFKLFKALRKHLKKHGFDVQEMERDMKQNWNLVFLVNKK